MSTTGIYRTEICIPYRGVDQDIEVAVTYEAIPFERGGTDGLYGPKIEPDIPAHIEIHRVVTTNGYQVELTSAQEKCIEEQIAEHLADDDYFQRSEHADRLRDAQRDDD